MSSDVKATFLGRSVPIVTDSEKPYWIMESTKLWISWIAGSGLCQMSFRYTSLSKNEPYSPFIRDHLRILIFPSSWTLSRNTSFGSSSLLKINATWSNQRYEEPDTRTIFTIRQFSDHLGLWLASSALHQQNVESVCVFQEHPFRC